MTEIRLGDIGVSLRITVKDQDDAVVDLSSATVSFLVEKPGGSIATFTASNVTDGTDGLVEYITESGDIDEVGIWTLQVKVVIGSTTYRSTENKFRVMRKII